MSEPNGWLRLVVPVVGHRTGEVTLTATYRVTCEGVDAELAHAGDGELISGLRCLVPVTVTSEPLRFRLIE